MIPPMPASSLPLTFSPPLCCSLLILSSLQTTGRITFRQRTTRTVRCECLFLRPPPTPLRTLPSRRPHALVVGLSASCLPLFPNHSFHLTPGPTLALPRPSASNQISSSRLALLCPPRQLDFGAAEQQGGGAEPGFQGRPPRRREQHRAGADQGHPGGGEEDDGERRVLRLRRAQ